MANKKELVQTWAHSPALFGPRRKTSLASPFFTPFSFSLPPLELSPRRDTKGQKRESERNGWCERRRDIDITFTECPFTLPLLSLEKVKTRFSPLLGSLAPPYLPPVAPCMKKKKPKQDFSALPPISPFVVYAHSVLAFTMHPSFPSPPIYCDLAPLNDGAYTCLQD